MELTKEQLLQIDNYIYVCGITYYDVRTEIVDHFANILEQKLDENPDLNFKKEIEIIHRNFSDRGFSKLLKEKTNSVQKKFYKASFKHFITFFKLPKVITAVALFFLLQFYMNWFDDTLDFFRILAFIILVPIIAQKIYAYFFKNQNEKFLMLDKSTLFILFIGYFCQIFHLITSFRKPESFLNPVHNNIQLGVFVLLLLFYWSGEYVFYQNKKLVKKQYPNVLV